MHLASLSLSNFRNYLDLHVELEPEGALLKGPNGSGKTNLLEAVHLLCVGRSQRGARRADMVRHDAEAASVVGTFVDVPSGGRTEARFGFDRHGGVAMSRDGRPVATRREWFGGAAVVALGPEDIALVAGAPVGRRRFIDMLISQVDSAYLTALLRYNRALANRNRLLGAETDEGLFDVCERQMVEAGECVHRRRSEIVALCQEWFARDYATIAGGSEAAGLQLRPAVTSEKTGSDEWKNVFYNTLKNNRKRDVGLGYSSRGPHRDDLCILLDKRRARTFASQGQLRSLALALRLSAVRCIDHFRRERMLVLVDDAFSELDERRMARVYPLLRGRGQVLMATPVDRIPAKIDIPRFAVSNGTVAAG